MIDINNLLLKKSFILSRFILSQIYSVKNKLLLLLDKNLLHKYWLKAFHLNLAPSTLHSVLINLNFRNLLPHLDL